MALALALARAALLRPPPTFPIPTIAIRSPSSSPSPSLPPSSSSSSSPALPPRPKVRCFCSASSSSSSSSSSSPSETSRAPSRLAQTRRLIEESESRSSEPIDIPSVSLEHVTVNFARSGGPGGQNVNKVNTKVDMRFNVEAASWLPQRIREKLLQMEKNRINSEGELVITSTKTRTQKGNIEDALSKLQALIDAAAYVPPPPSEETKNKINRLARIENERRLDTKKKASLKKANRRGGWD